MKVNDEVLRKLTAYFTAINFEDVGAHEVCRQLSIATGNSIITDCENTKDREVYFFSLGVAYAHTQEKYRTIPPINENHPMQTEEKK
jgi:hypothetical protein